MDSEKLKTALDWAFENEDDDSMATAYVGICHAIGSMDEEAVCLSKIVNLKIGQDEHPIDSELFRVDRELDDLVDHLYRARDSLCLLINKILEI